VIVPRIAGDELHRAMPDLRRQGLTPDTPLPISDRPASSRLADGLGRRCILRILRPGARRMKEKLKRASGMKYRT